LKSRDTARGFQEERRRSDTERERERWRKRKRDGANGRTREEGRYGWRKRQAEREGEGENGYEPSIEFEACLNRLQLPERMDGGTGGCYDDHAPSNYAKIALRTLDPSSPPCSPRASHSVAPHPPFIRTSVIPISSLAPSRGEDVSEDKRLAELCLSMNFLEAAISFGAKAALQISES